MSAQISKDIRVEFIRLGYECAMEFKVTIDSFEQFGAAVKAIGQYNGFDPSTVINAFADIWDDVSSVELGREYSPVIYVSLPYWHGHTYGNRGQHTDNDARLSPTETNQLRQRIIQAGERAKADENYPVGLNSWQKDSLVRLWWD